MNFFKNLLTKKVNIFAPASGQLISLTSVSDNMFSQKMMGDGYAVKPSEDNIYSPISGTIVSIFPTKHAVTLKSDDGLDVLIHLGVDTVELKGKPFKINVQEGQKIKAGELIGTMNIDAINKAGKSDEIIVVFTNIDKVKQMSYNTPGKIQHGEEIGFISLA